MEQMMRQLINDVFYDLEEAGGAVGGEKLDAEILADVLGDRMYDMSEEYRNTPYVKRRAMCLQIASEYV
jgi:hypothetical protein